MSVQYAEVYLWSTRVGIVSYDDNDFYARFEYDKDFLRSEIEISPIVMPLSENVYYFPNLDRQTFKGLPGLLADSLPDRFGDAIIDSWLESSGLNPYNFSPIDRLCYVGQRGMGALEFIPSTGPETTSDEIIEINKMVDVASKVLSRRKELHFSKEDIGYANLLKFSTSAGGAKAKAVVAINKKTNEICSGQISNKKGYSYWIIKFDEVTNNGDHNQIDSKGYTKVEYAYYLLAKLAKINMSECRLYENNGMHHFMTRRFDRKIDTGEKIHMQSLCGLTHIDYNEPRACSYELASKYCLKLGIGNDEICELYRRMVFNVLAINNDDHVKNISFLMDRSGKWSLAPAYDLCFSYNSNSKWVSQHQMTINNKSKDINYFDLLQCADSMNIKRTKAKQIIEDVASAVKNWKQIATKANVNQEYVELIDSMIDKQLAILLN